MVGKANAVLHEFYALNKQQSIKLPTALKNRAPMGSIITPCQCLYQGSATYSTHATLGMPSIFEWHTEAPCCTY